MSVQALDKDLYGQIIGVRGNIATGTQLWIKNLQESSAFKTIWAETIASFQ